MRSFAVVLLGLVAVALGVCAAATFQLAGLAWIDGEFAATGQWEEPESGFGVAIALLLLLLVPLALIAAIAVGEGGRVDGRARRRTLTTIVTASSAIGVLLVCGLALLPPSTWR